MKINLIFYLMAFSLYSQEHRLEVGEMNFNGNKMFLSSDFKWEHPIGKIQGKTAEAVYSTLNRGLPEEITMSEGVEIILNDGGTLKAPYAWLNCSQWLGIFHGNEGNKIFFQSSKEDFSLKSLKMELTFIPPSGGHFVLLQQLIADGNVEIEMHPNIEITADCAIFNQFLLKQGFGSASLLAEDSSRLCLVKQKNDKGLINEISACQIDLNLKNHQINFFDAKGILNGSKEPIQFTAHEMLLDKDREYMQLKAPIWIKWIGTIETTGEVKIFQKQKEFNRIELEGPTQLKWKNSAANEEHTLTVTGQMIIDSNLNTIDMSSLENEQIYFSDCFGQIYADQMILTYQEKETKFEPIQLSLKGNVRLENCTALASQYALADQALFEFDKNTLSLTSTVRPRVLFYDELNKIQASAPGLIINRDPTTGQDAIRGIGNVRFMFAEDELNELKKRFSFEPR